MTEIVVTETQREIRQRVRHAWRTRPNGNPVGWMYYQHEYVPIYDSTGLHCVDNIHRILNGRYLPIFVDPQ